MKKRRFQSRKLPRMAVDFVHHTLPVLLRKATVRQVRRNSFRTSSFPLCSRYVALSDLRKEVQGVVYGRRAFKNDAYFAAGHAAHETTQFWMGQIGFLYGHWKCKYFTSRWSKGKTVETRVYCGYEEERWGTKHCPRCMSKGIESWLHYEEYKLHVKSRLRLDSAHTDGLTWVNPDGVTQLPIPQGTAPNTIFEGKTTSDAHFKELKKIIRAGGKPEPKSAGHHQQASGYAELVEDQMGDKWGEDWEGIRWLMYGYINRNHPWQVIFFLCERINRSVVRPNSIRYNLGRLWVKRARPGDELPAGRCSTVEDASGFQWYGLNWMGCPEKQACFGIEGDGGIEGGDRPEWIDDYLVQIDEP